MNIRTLFLIFIFCIFLVGQVSGQVVIGEDSDRGLGVVIGEFKTKIKSFLDLSDTPSTYSGSGGDCVKVVAGENGLEFGDCGSGGSDASNWSEYDAISDVNIAGFNINNVNEITTSIANITGTYTYFPSGYTRNFGVDNKFFDWECYVSGGQECWMRMYRFSNSTGDKRFIIFKGDGTAVQTFSVNASTGHITTISNESVTNLNADLLDGQEGSYYESTYNETYDEFAYNQTQRLNEILDPDESKLFILGGNTLGYTFTNPAGGILYNFTGGASGHLIEFIQSGGSPVGTHLLHIEAEDDETLPLHIFHTNPGLETIRTNGYINVTDEVYIAEESVKTWLYNQTTPAIEYANNLNLTNLDDVFYIHQAGAVIVDNGTDFIRLDQPVLNGDYQLEVEKSGSTFTFSWGNTVPIAPAWSAVLTQGRTSSGTNPQITTGDSIEFRDVTHNITSSAVGQLDVSAPNKVVVGGNVTISNESNSLLIKNDQSAFKSESFPLADMFFDSAGTNSRVSIHSTTGLENWYVQVFGANADMYLKGALALGSNDLSSLNDGDINASTIYYNTLTAKSPQLFEFSTDRGKLLWMIDFQDFNKGIEEATIEVDNNYDLVQSTTLTPRMEDKLQKYQREKKDKKNYQEAKETCELQDYYIYASYSEWLKGSRSCTFSQDWANDDCRENNGQFYKYERGICIVDEEAQCNSVDWKIWIDGECVVNDYRECKYNGFIRNESWDGLKCSFDSSIECSNRGNGWNWNGKECLFDSGRKGQDDERDCFEKGRGWRWLNGQCIGL